jgi:hypothetical protein
MGWGTELRTFISRLLTRSILLASWSSSLLWVTNTSLARLSQISTAHKMLLTKMWFLLGIVTRICPFALLWKWFHRD